jgi:hypothetical protein
MLLDAKGGRARREEREAAGAATAQQALSWLQCRFSGPVDLQSGCRAHAVSKASAQHTTIHPVADADARPHDAADQRCLNIPAAWPEGQWQTG